MHFGQLKRREFMTLLGGAGARLFASNPTSAQAAGRTYRLGVLTGRARDSDFFAAFFDELHLFGISERENLTVLPEGFNLRNEEFPIMAAALVKAAPDVIVAGGQFAARITHEATRTIPIVALADDMIEAGLVRSLARPGGNITGISLLDTELDGKRQDILIEAVPGVRRIAALQ
jgi:putative tryptophan/tyrosine transport system substrate-binding protein